MAFSDAILTFVPSALSLVAGAGIAIPTGPIDLLGEGAGLAPLNIIGRATLFGTDFGVGAHVLELMCRIGTLPVTATSATLNLQWQFAPDAGTPTYQPGTWYTVIESGAMAVANLAAGTRIGAWKYPQMFPFNQRPRFTRLNFVVPAGTNFTAGTISQGFLTSVAPGEYAIANQPSNYTIA